MKRFKFWVPVLAIALSGLFLNSCGGSGNGALQTVENVQDKYEVEGVSFKMVSVPAATFGMGTRPDGRLVAGSGNIHQVVLDSYAISEYPVSQALWKAVMGSNPSAVQGDNYPVSKVDAKTCGKFIQKLSKMTGVPFCLPTEAQWEYAINHQYAKFVKNAREWTADAFAPEPVQELAINPRIADPSGQKVVRTPLERLDIADYTKSGDLTFRLAVNMNGKCSDAVMKMIVEAQPEREHTCQNEKITVNGYSFDMVAVHGGKFSMGAGAEQGKYADDDEKPIHEKEVEDFEIGKYEVTVGLWKAVMGEVPAGNKASDQNLPVVNISWYRAQEFIIKLNELTGRKFRLPTETEWEYAAKGGRTPSKRFSGDNNLKMVGAYVKNAQSELQPVGTYLANELRIVEMSGNAWEWCQDAYAGYGKEPADRELRVMRGGSASSPWEACRVTNRSKIPASNIKRTFGFRLAL